MASFAGFLALVAPRERRVEPWLAVPLLVAFVALGVAAAYWSSAGIDVAANEGGVRWSFRKRELAEAFAADNDAAIETKALPGRADDEHDPDRVDHTGLHGDVSGDGGGSD